MKKQEKEGRGLLRGERSGPGGVLADPPYYAKFTDPQNCVLGWVGVTKSETMSLFFCFVFPYKHVM